MYNKYDDDYENDVATKRKWSNTCFGISASSLVLALLFFIFGIWSGDGRLDGTGGILLIPAFVAVVVGVCLRVDWDDF
jgi:hypothetical protein